jgi:hypothetical protein
VTHNPYQKKIKHPPTLSTNESHSRSWIYVYIVILII